MADIVWYPGHMAKAKRLIKEALPKIDLVIQLLDARAPVSSRNPDFEQLFCNKKTLTLLTKSNLADRNATDLFVKRSKNDGLTVIPIDCKTGYGIKGLPAAIREVMKEKLERDAAKGIKRPVRAMIVGITNVGKSTLINTLSGTKKAAAEDRPGVTRHNSWIAVPSLSLELMDTPGLLWHKFDDRTVGVKLAALGSIKDDILDTYSLSVELVGLLRKKYTPLLCSSYGITVEESDTDLEVFEKIGKRRGFLRSGGVIDEDRTAARILDEFRSGKTGQITLDWE